MDKNKFNQLVEPLGKFKRKWAGAVPHDENAWNETVLKLNYKEAPCPDCFKEGRYLIYDTIPGYKNKKRWRTKCLHCKETWNRLIL